MKLSDVLLSVGIVISTQGQVDRKKAVGDLIDCTCVLRSVCNQFDGESYHGMRIHHNSESLFIIQLSPDIL